MSPAAKKPAAPKAREVKSSTGTTTVRITAGTDKTITVAWLCGGARVFTIEELRKHIELADGSGTKHPMWLNLIDARKSGFYVRLKDGQLTANDHLRENGFVPWADLKRELQAMIAETLA